jgi:hypothetical protein
MPWGVKVQLGPQSLPVFLVMKRSIIGRMRIDEVCGSTDMIVVPDVRLVDQHLWIHIDVQGPYGRHGQHNSSDPWHWLQHCSIHGLLVPAVQAVMNSSSWAIGWGVHGSLRRCAVCAPTQLFQCLQLAHAARAMVAVAAVVCALQWVVTGRTRGTRRQ